VLTRQVARAKPRLVTEPSHKELLISILGGGRLESMTAAEVDGYISALEEPKRATLEHLRRTILAVIPDAEEGISYGVPAFRLRGKVVAGFAGFKNHLSYLPHSGSVFPELRDELASYRTSTGALQFPIDTQLPKPVVEQLLRVRIAQEFPG
jgi:uncharacterized protein YdhG (YjbR/CyaY superfamily)